MEKEQCKYCVNKVGVDKEFPTKDISFGALGEYEMSLSVGRRKGKGNIAVYITNKESADDIESMNVEVKYCPFCGKRLAEEKGG